KTPERAWLGEVSAVVLQQALADLNTAYRNFFASASGKRKGPKVAPPRFRSRKDNRQAIRFTRNARFAITAGGRLRLPKIGDVPVKWSRRLPSEPSSVTVIKDAAGRYFASFVVEAPAEPLPQTAAEVGIGADALRGALGRPESRQPPVSPPCRTAVAQGAESSVPQGEGIEQPHQGRRSRGPRPREGGRRAPGLHPPALHPDHPREPSGDGGGLVREGPGPHAAGQVRARRRMVGVREHAGVQGRPVRPDPGEDRPLVPQQQAVLGLRRTGRVHAAERPV